MGIKGVLNMKEPSIHWNEFIINKNFTADDIACGRVNYGLHEFKEDLYQAIRTHVTSEGESEFFVNLLGEALLTTYYLNFSLEENSEKVFKALMKPKTPTRMFGKVELKKMYKLHKENMTMFAAIIVKKFFDCEDMSMNKRQITTNINNYAQKEIFDKFLTREQMLALK